uniref:DNA methyltransferase n=1 Tax=Enterococcus faecalis TaxID=1351 RepID=UPI001F196F4C|nr:DNA methyltransferase [Enterococcus faecalis]
MKTYTKPGELVLDNCMGSGTTAIACLNTDRKFIGFETNLDYYKQSLDRIKENCTQVSLF